jgi:predicted MFS family arabinose efflux permease
MKEKNFHFLLYSIALTGISIAMHQVAYKNFLLDSLSFTPNQYGLTDGIKEVPGLLAIGLILVASRFREKSVWISASIMIALGLFLYSVSNNFSWIVVSTLMFSIGTHLRSIQGDYLVTDFSTEQDRSLKFGKVASYSAGASLIGMALVWLVSLIYSFDAIFVISAVFALVGSIVAAKIVHARDSHLSAAREMFFITFGTLLLIEKFSTSVQTMAILMVIHGVLAIITRPIAGKVIQRMGDGKTLAINYSLVTMVFIGYAMIENIWIIYFLFIIDDVLVGFDDIGISTYVGRSIPRNELNATLAMGSTLSHIIAVCIPIAGTIIWSVLGSMVIFLIGCIVTISAAVFSLKLSVISAQ